MYKYSIYIYIICMYNNYKQRGFSGILIQKRKMSVGLNEETSGDFSDPIHCTVGGICLLAAPRCGSYSATMMVNI